MIKVAVGNGSGATIKEILERYGAIVMEKNGDIGTEPYLLVTFDSKEGAKMSKMAQKIEKAVKGQKEAKEAKKGIKEMKATGSIKYWKDKKEGDFLVPGVGDMKTFGKNKYQVKKIYEKGEFVIVVMNKVVEG